MQKIINLHKYWTGTKKCTQRRKHQCARKGNWREWQSNVMHIFRTRRKGEAKHRTQPTRRRSSRRPQTRTSLRHPKEEWTTLLLTCVQRLCDGRGATCWRRASGGVPVYHWINVGYMRVRDYIRDIQDYKKMFSAAAHLCSQLQLLSMMVQSTYIEFFSIKNTLRVLFLLVLCKSCNKQIPNLIFAK